MNIYQYNCTKSSIGLIDAQKSHYRQSSENKSAIFTDSCVTITWDNLSLFCSQEEYPTVNKINWLIEEFIEIILKKFINVEMIDCCETKIKSFKGLPELPELKYLYCDYCEFSSLEHIPNLPQLKELDLSGNKLKSLDYLKHYPNLEKLGLLDNKLESSTNLDLIKHVKSVELDTDLNNLSV